MKFLSLLALISLLVSGCARAPVKSAEEALRASAPPAQITDSLGTENFLAGLRRLLAEWPKARIPALMQFGEVKIESERYRESLAALEKDLAADPSAENLDKLLRERFQWFEVYGREDWGEAMVTGYYDPVITGSHRKTKQHAQPLYRTPQDLVTVDVNAFFAARPDLAALQAQVIEQKSREAILRGRLEGNKVVPYYDRAAIDGEGKLRKRGLELAWLDPVDAFFLQIQGSGLLKLASGKRLRVGYEAQNGHTYQAIGKFLLDKIPLEEMSMQKIAAHLRSLTPEERQALLDKNPSYVFFRELEGEYSQTYSGTSVIAGRTAATDQTYFPKGALAYLDVELPLFADAAAEAPQGWQAAPRLVFDQDTGGAIRGAGRLDLYLGEGTIAAQAAGVMKRNGRLYYLAPR